MVDIYLADDNGWILDENDAPIIIDEEDAPTGTPVVLSGTKIGIGISLVINEPGD